MYSKKSLSKELEDFMQGKIDRYEPHREEAKDAMLRCSTGDYSVWHMGINTSDEAKKIIREKTGIDVGTARNDFFNGAFSFALVRYDLDLKTIQEVLDYFSDKKVKIDPEPTILGNSYTLYLYPSAYDENK